MKSVRTVRHVTRVLAVGASIWLGSCGGSGREANGRVEDSSRDPLGFTQQQPSSTASRPKPEAVPRAATPPATRELAPRESPQAPRTAIPPPVDTARPTDDRTFIGAKPQSIPAPVRPQSPRAVGTSGTLEGGRPLDEVLLDRVESLLATDARLRAVQASVDNGVVLLKGAVADPLARDRAFSIAKSVAGSRGVVARFSTVPR